MLKKINFLHFKVDFGIIDILVHILMLSKYDEQE